MTVKATAVRLLARREHSAYELGQKLLLREFEADDIAQVIAELKQGGWLSDERFAAAYIRMRRLKGFGPVRIRRELQTRGVDETLVDTLLDGHSETWQQALQQQYEKKCRHKRLVDFADKAKCIRFLQYRGFALDAIRKVMT